MKKVGAFAAVSFSALFVDFLLLRYLNYFSFTPIYAFGLMITGVAFFVLACRQSRIDERVRARKVARRSERIAAGEKLKSLKPYKAPWYVGGFGFLIVVFLIFAIIAFYSIRSSRLSTDEYIERYGSQQTETAASETTPVLTPDSDVAAADPTVAPVPDPVTYTGSGDDVVEIPPFPGALYVFEITGNDAERNFAVKTYTSNGEYSELLVNTLDKYHGITMDPGFDVSTIEVKSAGDWTIIQRSIYDMDIMQSGQTYNGTGDSIVLVKGGGSTATITGNDAERNFIVRVYNSQGRSSLLVNELDKYTGNVMLNDPVIFQISAVGDWSIALD